MIYNEQYIEYCLHHHTPSGYCRMTQLLPSIQRRNPEHDFQLLKQVGSGTYGEVYKVRTLCQLISTCYLTSTLKLKLLLFTVVAWRCVVVYCNSLVLCC